MRLNVFALIALLWMPISVEAVARNVGFETAHIADSAGQMLDAGIWYPTDAAPSPHRLGPYSQQVALGAAPGGAPLPLIVISHGSGGWFGGHADTAVALAQAGFVVAAVTHKGDSSDDGSRRAEIWIRPPQLKRLVDYMLTAWPGRGHIDADRIGVFGFSAGGFTALVAAGGTPNLRRVLPYCRMHPKTQTCGVLNGSPDALKTLALRMPASAWVHDPRIKAAVVAAPALGFTFGTDGLRDVHVPIQLWRAEHDNVLPYPDYADAVRASLPVPPDFRVARNAGHYDFMAPCPSALAKEVPEICAEKPGFDRAGFHQQLNDGVVAFFRRTLLTGR